MQAKQSRNLLQPQERQKRLATEAPIGQRQIAQYFTQQNSYHVVMEVLPELQGRVDSLDKIYIKSPVSGAEVPLAAGR